MRTVVNDASCIIGLKEAGLLHASLLLPFVFQIALPLVRSELVGFAKTEIDDLVARGLTIVDVLPEGVRRAITLKFVYSGLSFNDCLSIALAESQPRSILLTGDQTLQNRASTIGIEVHDVHWVTSKLKICGHLAFANP